MSVRIPVPVALVDARTGRKVYLCRGCLAVVMRERHKPHTRFGRPRAKLDERHAIHAQWLCPACRCANVRPGGALEGETFNLFTQGGPS